jgi:hypothetical protein
VRKTGGARGAWRWHPAKTRGRPPRDRVASDIKITVRLTADESRRFRRAAGKQPLSAWLRDLGNLCAAGRVHVLEAA